jgi:hypothetical protein
MYNDEEERERAHREHQENQAAYEVDLPPSSFETADDASHHPADEATTPAGSGGSAPLEEKPALEAPKTLRDRLLSWFQSFRERLEGQKGNSNASGTLTARSRVMQDRSKVTMAIAGASILAIVLFLVTFTRPSVPYKPKDQHAHPNLGRPENSQPDDRSVVPLRTAGGVKPDEKDGTITAQDVLNTTKLKPRSNVPTPAAPNQNKQDYAVNRIPFPAEGAPPATQPAAAPQPEKYQPSLVFVRSASSEHSSLAAQPVSAGYTPVVMSAFFSALPPGTRLVARLESPVSTALKNTPAVAAIEYNYSRDGEVVIPAGSKAFGKLSSANEHGFVELAFDTIELPDGTTQKIYGFGESLTYQPIKGAVTGRNIGLQFLVQSLTGVGSIAAATVGNQGGTGINDSLSNNAILRERLSENIATAGQNQMSNLAYRQNIVVTVPGNTRFYLVLGRSEQDRERNQSSPAARPVPAAAPTSPSVQNASMETQYMQELEGLKRQLDQLSRQQQQQQNSEPPGQTQNALPSSPPQP